LPPGQLPRDAEPAEWIASRFAEWWKSRADDGLGEGELALSLVKEELRRLGGWEACGEAMDDCCRLEAALGDLRAILGLAPESGSEAVG
jgi:hypothetical protein